MRSFFRTAVFLAIAAVLAVVLTPGTVRGDEGFSVRRVGNLIPYEKNEFLVRSPEDGTLTIRIHDDITVYREITQQIEAGETSIRWDGCGYNREKLYSKSYTVTAELTAESGKQYTVSFLSPVGYSGQSLQYALPSSYRLYLDAPETWFLEFKTIMKGVVRMELTPETDSGRIYEYSMNAAGGKINRKDFSAVAGDELPPAGRYHAKVYVSPRKDEGFGFELEILEGKPERKEIFITGGILPERGMSDAEIWEMMMKPSVVLDIDFFSHQEVYEKPDSESRTLGTLHGQTQALKVIRIENGWAQIGAWNHEEAEYVEGWVPAGKLKVEEPQPGYGILIDKQTQTLTVYREGKVLDTLLVSTGRADRNRYEQETSAGSFLTGYHRVDFSMNGNKYDYVIQYDGGNLLHQTPYAWGSFKKDFTLGRGYLGAKASHACIRIQSEPGAGGVNAYWLWTHIPYHTRVMILDDPTERRDSIGRLKRSRSFEKSGAMQQLHITSEKEETGTEQVVLTFAGEMIPGGKPGVNSRKDSFASRVAEGGINPFASLAEWFENDDCTCILLTGQLKDAPETYLPGTEPEQAPRELASCFGAGSVELVAICEDEAYGYGKEAVRTTCEAIRPYAAALEREDVHTVSLKGHLFGFACCSESEYLKDPSVIDQRIGKLKEKNCERIIFLCSWGKSRDKTHTIVQEAMAHRCVRAGADLVVGHHPDRVQGIDRIEGKPVVYGTGLLLDGSASGSRSRQTGMLVQVVFGFGPDDSAASVRLIPVVRQENGKKKGAALPAAASSREEASGVIAAVWEDSPDRVLEETTFLISGKKSIGQ